MGVLTNVADHGGKVACCEWFHNTNGGSVSIGNRRHVRVREHNYRRRIFAAAERFHDGERLAMFIKIDNDGIDVCQITAQDLPRATPRACPAYTVRCSNCGIDDRQVGVYITVRDEKDVCFHAYLIKLKKIQGCAAFAKLYANLALLLLPLTDGVEGPALRERRSCRAFLTGFLCHSR
jgi:hypothetical protein